jgi:hypothetical protein
VDETSNSIKPMNSQEPNWEAPSANPKNLNPRRARRAGRKVLSGAVAFVALVALFYAEEDWRGRRAFGQCKAELERRGEVFGWGSVVPPPVPDDQNILKGPLLGAYLPASETSDPLSRGRIPSSQTNRPEYARFSAMASTSGLTAYSESRRKIHPCEVEVTFGPFAATTPGAGTNQVFTASNAATGLLSLARETYGEVARDARNYIIFLPGPLQPGRPVQLRLEKEDELKTIKAALGQKDYLLEPGANPAVFELRPRYGAAAEDVLAYFQGFEPEMAEIHQELERPGARYIGDYRPFNSPHANFVRVRTLAQALACRALAAIYCGQPDVAATEIQALFRLAEAADGGSTTLVSTMICVAIHSLAENLIETGFQRGVWGTAHYAALEIMIKPIDVARKVGKGARGERANVLGLFVDGDPREAQAQLEALPNPLAGSRWKEFKEKWLSPEGFYLRVAPKGWLLQGATLYTRGIQGVIESFNKSDWSVDPARLEEAMARNVRMIERGEPFAWLPVYSWIPRIALPNYLKAADRAARNQTKLNQARIACGLELFRVAEGAYPERLDQLVPKHLDSLPRDVIKGGEMKYRREANGKYVLYSLGWDAKDDGGDSEKGRDWVWLAKD